MSAEQLLAAYPNCPIAVAFCELILSEAPEGEKESSFDMLRSSNMTEEEVLTTIRQCLKEEIEEGTEGKNEEALQQTYHPSFRTYLAAKLGLF